MEIEGEVKEMRREELADLRDKQITCKICGDNFTFAIGEQEFYQDRWLAEPRRCSKCRPSRRNIPVREGGQDGELPSTLLQVQCKQT